MFCLCIVHQEIKYLLWDLHQSGNFRPAEEVLINSTFPLLELTRGITDRLSLCRGGSTGHDLRFPGLLRGTCSTEVHERLETSIGTREIILSLKFTEGEAKATRN